MQRVYFVLFYLHSNFTLVALPLRVLCGASLFIIFTLVSLPLRVLRGAGLFFLNFTPPLRVLRWIFIFHNLGRWLAENYMFRISELLVLMHVLRKIG